MLLANYGMKRDTSQLKKSFFTIKRKENNSIIETKYDKHGNKVSIDETEK